MRQKTPKSTPSAARVATATRPADFGRGRRERTLRIIAGQWRGRRWRFPEAAIRPTPDRVRETLFNWLQLQVPGSRCLDLYAGSGALGLEALSRGAAAVEFVEQSRAVAAALGKLLQDWGATGARVNTMAAWEYLQRPPVAPFHLAFLDPPFDSQELVRVLPRLDQAWLAPSAMVYLESPISAPVTVVPEHWESFRSSTAGAVRYDLYRVGGPKGA